MNAKKIAITIGATLGVLLIIFLLTGSNTDAGDTIVVGVEEGSFRVEVNTTGELEARNSTQITGPRELRKYRIYQTTIQKIIPEGSYVQKGDFVASLDPSEINTKIRDTEIDLDERQARYVETKLDTALVMRELRDNLVNLTYELQEKVLVLEQSEYEPPATIKKAEIELAKAKRQLAQQQENYKIKRDQNIAKMRIASSNLREKELQLEGMYKLLKEFTILAPEDGMVIYRKGWNGKAIKEGSQISAWDPVVAELPDLSSMNSITYINEVDIRKVKKGHSVDIGLDAFPDKRLTGVVRDVANVGEQKPNSDAKVFKVTVAIDEIDDNMRPGMTTSNNIITEELENTLFIPLECLHSFNDTVTYVYKSAGIGHAKQEVLVGLTNANFAEILLGLSAQDRVYLSMPAATDRAIKLLPELEGKRSKKAQNLAPKPKPSNTQKKDFPKPG